MENDIHLPNAPNFRDIGGKPVARGGWVRHGRAYRSGKLSRLDAAELAYVNSLGIRAVIDLRTEAERALEPSRWAGTPPTTTESKRDRLTEDLDAILSAIDDTANFKRAVVRFYERLPFLYQDDIGALFRLLASGDGIVLFHCTAGKDRTGVASALLLTLLGVEWDDVVADYLLTTVRTAHLFSDDRRQLPIGGDPRFEAALKAAPAAVWATMWGTDAAYLLAMRAAVEREYGSIERYATIGLDLGDEGLAALRRNLVTRGDER